MTLSDPGRDEMQSTVGRGGETSGDSLLARALDRLSAFGLPEPVGSGVSRVEVGSSDVDPSLVLTVETASGERWFRATRTGIAELHPADDRVLPLARALGGAEVLSYRPGRRLVVLREREGAVEKGYRNARFEAAAMRHELATSLAGRIPGLMLPRLLERRAATASLRLERIAGTPLRIQPSSVERFAAVGVALRAFQEAPHGGAALPRHSAGDELAVVDSWAARVRRATGNVAPGWPAARDAAARLAAVLPAAPATLAHRDLHDGQLLDTGGAVALLDFDLMARADPALDAGNLLAHFELRRQQRFPGTDSATAASAAEALLAGLGRGEEPGFHLRLAFYRGATLLRLALVYELRPRWRQLAPALTEEGARCFESAD